MSVVKSILDDLREKRLWPVALALVVALVAVPMLLSSSTTGQPLAQLPQTGPAAPAGSLLPVVSVNSTPTHSRLRARGRDPFRQQKLPTPKPTSPTGTATTPTGTATTPTGTTTTATGTTTTATGTTTTTTPAVTPAPTGLTARQSYRITLSVTTAAGGVDRIDPLERLSVLPSFEQARLIDLGVLNGGRRVLFVVEPGTIVTGPGTCTPGPIDCQILSLAQNQIEDISTQSPNGPESILQFAVTAITTDEHSSVAAASAARRRESAAGRRVLKLSTLSALPLFQYRASLGAVADLRNLTVGGS
jgi:hypothetical protein